MIKHVFLSFVAEDLATVNLFRGQAKNRNSDLTFDDYSVKAPYNSVNASYIRSQIQEKIRAASATIVLIGADTSSSTWVDWEIRKSYEMQNKVIGMRLNSVSRHPVPFALTFNRAQILNWNVDEIVRAIG